MRLKTLFLAGMGIFACLVMLPLIVVVIQELRELQSVDVAKGAIDVLRSALKVSEHLALERGGHNEALLKDPSASPDTIAVLDRLREQTDEAFNQTFTALRRATYPGVPDHEAELQNINSDLRSLRERALAETAVPKSERNSQFTTGYAHSIFDLTARVTNLQAGIELAAQRVDSQVAQYAGVARVVGLLRDLAGRKQTLFVQILSSGAPIETATELLLADGDARIEVLWMRALTIVRLTNDDRLLAAVEGVQRNYFEANARVYAQIRAAQPPRAGWPGDVASFRAWGVPTLQS